MGGSVRETECGGGRESEGEGGRVRGRESVGEG